jgi:lipoic acid synthetase
MPDVRATLSALEVMIDGGVVGVSLYMETVKRLYRLVRPQAKYERSLEQIKRTKAYGSRTKSGIMVGLGETKDEVLEVMDDLRAHDCDVLTIGQYLQPTPMHLDVDSFVHPDTFAMYKEEGDARGFDFVESGPLVRSSYHAERHL